MLKWLIASSFVQNQVNDLIRAACYASGAWAVGHGFVPSTKENALIGSLFFLGAAAWQYVENRIQDNDKQVLKAQAGNMASRS